MKKGPTRSSFRRTYSFSILLQRQTCNTLLHAYKRPITSSQSCYLFSDILFFTSSSLGCWEGLQNQYRLLTSSHEAAAPPTSLVCSDVHGREMRCVRALVRHSIDSLDLETVLCVGLQVTDSYSALGQPQVAGRDIHVVVAPRAHPSLWQTLFADDVVEDVVTAAQVTRLAPL